jgi:hypothetical protein
MRKIEDSDYSNDILTVDLIRYQFFSRAVRFLSHNSIPAAHKGAGCAGICFGENARALDLSALEKPIIIDATAAAILEERGIDVGLATLGERFMPSTEHFIRYNEYIPLVYGSTKTPFSTKVTLKEGAVVESEWTEELPASYTYKNACGQTFLVLCMDAFACADEMYKNYARQAQMFDFLEDNGAAVPARCDKHPDLYVLCKENEDTLAIALFNCFADAIDGLSVKLGMACDTAVAYRAERAIIENGGKTLNVGRLEAYSWCYVELKKIK